MKNYSIVRIGHEYVVQADEQSVLKVASRRRAAKLVSVATELMDSCPVVEIPPRTEAEPSIVPSIEPDLVEPEKQS
jgi:hypothetical protein